MTLMRKIALCAVLALSTAWSAVAQETNAETGAETDGETSIIKEPGSDLAIGEPAEEVGRPYIKETIQDWALRCLKTETGEERCQMYQLLNDEEDVPVIEFTLFRLPEGGRAEAGATVVVPLETALQQQLTITVDSGQARRYPFAFCNPVGCYARIGLTSDDVAAFKRGAVAKLTIAPFVAPNDKIVMNMSLKGFTGAYEKSSVLAQ